MALNKLDNFLKNTEGRILYVNPNDLDSTDSIENQGNSLARPFKTIQRALLEAARFSYILGNNNDVVEKTTILLFPGEHVVDNRPGWAIYDNSGAKVVNRSSGAEYTASSILSLGLDSVFDLTQQDNILYKFNSWYGGVVVPRGTSIVGLDLRKTKIRPKYVPNPTDPNVNNSAIFRITGACYFWQFSIFDGDTSSLVYTNPDNFSDTNLSTPTFSHHKLTCFEFCDGVNKIGSYNLTDLDMYYSKVSNAYNAYRQITEKFPGTPDGFAKRNPEWEIVGAFASDPLDIASIISGNGLVASSQVTVTTAVDHKLNVGTPIKIKGVGDGTGLTDNYNISTTVQTVLSSTKFTYLLPALDSYVAINPSPSFAGATVTVETDTVSGASPYIFNCSLRSVWGMNGLHADGNKSSGFRSTVVAQFTAVSLQKDDRAFTKYDQTSRTYQYVSYSTVYGSRLASESSQTDFDKIYHLDPDAVYRQGWESSHIKISNDAFIQIVSVFAIGFNKHFDAQTGGDASITNSNSNFGQISLASSGFKKEAFSKDNKAFITSIIPPKAVTNTEDKIDWISIDVGLTTSVGITSHLYLYGYTSLDSPPTSITQGYRIGAKVDDKLYFVGSGVTYSASIYMCDNQIASSGFTTALGTKSSVKTYQVTSGPSSNIFTVSSNVGISTGESIKIISDDGDLPENITAHQTYYAITSGSTGIKLASSYPNAIRGQEITVYGGSNLKILSRVSEKQAGELGSPIQYDPQSKNWFIHTNAASGIYNALSIGGTATYGQTTDSTFITRIIDNRSLDEKLYKFRAVIPKEVTNGKDPETAFVIQESSNTGAGNSTYFTRTSIGRSDYDYNKNPRFITTCSVSSSTVTVLAELPHNMNIGEVVIVQKVKSSDNTTGSDNTGYNGKFVVTNIVDANTFQYSTTDVFGVVHTPSTFTSVTSTRDENLPRFSRNDWGGNLFIYRNEVITPYIKNKQDGIYHLYILNANNQIANQFTNLKFSQLPSDLYPQLDRDNVDENPRAAKSYAKRSPIGAVVTNDLKKSITRESADLLVTELGIGLTISSITLNSGTATINFSRFHGLSGIVTGSITAGSGYNNGTYYGVKLLNTSQTGTWNGAIAKVVVSGTQVTSVDIISPGSGYSAGSLYFDQATIGAGNAAARYNITTAGIATNVGDVLQITGIGTTSSTYARISSVPSSTSVSFASTSGDVVPIPGQYAFVVAPSINITSSNYNSSTGITTFVTSSSHGLLAGNRFRVLDSSNNNLGDYIVKERVGVTTFTALTNKLISATGGYILKHGLSANDGVSDATAENLGSRGVFFYDNQSFKLTSAITNSTTTILISNSGIGTGQRLPMGSYIQIDNEIMRVVSSNNDTQATVERSIFGTNSEAHDANSVIYKINPLAVEFRRPSIIRASGHTFEYLGYGPGNYSTSLPQVQIKTLSEAEQFYSQAQERSAGVVVYTGMNNNGDFFNGNTKTISSSGEVVSYDIPNPTITGDTGKKSSSVYDELTINDRIIVEGGTSGNILSQFDGPVTFSKDVRFKSTVLYNDKVKFGSSYSDSVTITGGLVVNGSLVVNTGLVPDKNLDAYLGTYSNAFSEAYVGNIKIAQTDDNTIDTTTGNLKLSTPTGSNVGIQTNTVINGTLTTTYLNAPNISPIGSIMMWAGTLPDVPDNWQRCNGQALNTYSYVELHKIISNTYGGTSYTAGVTDQPGATTTFNLPAMVDKFVVGAGNQYNRGDTGGSDTVTLDITQIPSHSHDINDPGHFHYIGTNPCNSGSGDRSPEAPTTNPTSRQTGVSTTGITIQPNGGGLAHENRPPYIALHYIIRLK